MAVYNKTTGQAVKLASRHVDSSDFLSMVNGLRSENAALAGDNDLLRESMEDLQRSIDEIGWASLNGFGVNPDENGLQLDKLRKLLTNTRSLRAANPIVKRGVSARYGLIWGEGVTVKGNRTRNILVENESRVFSSAACEEIESALATDGNVFFLLDKRTQRITRVSMSQISDYVVDPDDGESLQFIKRTWTSRELNTTTGRVETVTKKMWYPTIEFVLHNPALPTNIGDTLVEQDQALNVVSANKQVGWVWGVPDLLPVMYWARAYKEFLEANYTLVRALARFAWKVTDTRAKGAGAKKAAVRIAQPTNTRGVDAGATVPMPGGMDMVAINKAGANVSFDAGRPLAAMVAAGLEIPLAVLLAEPKQSANNYVISLDPATVKSAQSRQRLWVNELTRMFAYLGASNAKVTFPPIQSDPIHRVIQSVVTAASTGMLFPAEVRELIIKALADFGVSFKNGVPEPEEWAAYANAKQLHAGTTPQATPDAAGGQRSPAGALADGDHEMRPTE